MKVKRKRPEKPFKSIMHIKHSKSRSYKTHKTGNIGAKCVYFNHDLLSCNNDQSGHYKQLCHYNKCDSFKM